MFCSSPPLPPVNMYYDLNVVWPGRPAQAAAAPPNKKQKGKQREVPPSATSASNSPLDGLGESERAELEKSTRMAIKRVFCRCLIHSIYSGLMWTCSQSGTRPSHTMSFYRWATSSFRQCRISIHAAGSHSLSFLSWTQGLPLLRPIRKTVQITRLCYN